MLRQPLGELHRFLAWDGHLHRLEDAHRPCLEEETEQEATAIPEQTAAWLRRPSWADCSLAACRS